MDDIFTHLSCYKSFYELFCQLLDSFIFQSDRRHIKFTFFRRGERSCNKPGEKTKKYEAVHLEML